jgi:methylmalonyl-CoA carboxyltransferase 12S subunit
MTITNNEIGRILEAIEQLRGDLARLEARIDALEDHPAPAQETDAPATTIDPETMMSIGAALAAYFGKKPRIRSIRLLRSDAWAQEGRATIQAWYSVSTRPMK